MSICHTFNILAMSHLASGLLTDHLRSIAIAAIFETMPFVCSRAHIYVSSASANSLLSNSAVKKNVFATADEFLPAS